MRRRMFCRSFVTSTAGFVGAVVLRVCDGGRAAAVDAAQAGAGRQRLERDSRFESASLDELDPMTLDESATVALRAAWERVRRTIPAERQTRAVSPAAEALCRFLGFLEGRLRLCVPNWWRTSLLRVKAFDRDLQFPGGAQPLKYHESALGIAAVDGVDLEPRGERLVLRVHNAKSSIAASELALDGNAEHSRLSAVINDGRVILAQHGDFPSPFRIVCIDAKTGLSSWRADAGPFIPVNHSGPAFHVVALAADGERVVVYGVGHLVVYIEAFSVGAGGNLFRFSTAD